MRIPLHWSLALVLLTTASAALAHHSFAVFDRTKKVTLTGTVKDFQWTNPHAWIQVDVAGDKGQSTEWGVECGSPNMMARTGWKKTTLKAGDRITVIVNPLLDGRTNGSLVTATLADGTVLGPGDAPQPKPLGAQ
jgi:hypothetical protein